MFSSSSPSSDSSSTSSPKPTVNKKHLPSTTKSKKRKACLPEIEVDLALPEPSSKKAKRALKKQRPLPAKKDASSSSSAAAAANGDTKASSEKDPPQKKERSPHGIWIGNLRFTVTRDELRRWLVDNSGGAITHELITRVHLPPPPANPRTRSGPHAAPPLGNRGFAYVDFATYEANVAALALSELVWHRRRVLIKHATSFQGRPEELGKTSAAAAAAVRAKGEVGLLERGLPLSTSQKIFVGNLGFQTTEDDVRDLFARCGEIAWVKVATFEDSGKCKGYGWVKFAEPGAAETAVKGFVKIKKVEETEEVSMDMDYKEETRKGYDSMSPPSDDRTSSFDDGSASMEEEAKKKKPQSKPKPTPATKQLASARKVKMRKSWVNVLRGRRLKVEHAEGDETRYKKRFGGRRPRQQDSDKVQRPSIAGHRHSSPSRTFKDRGHGGREDQSAPAQAINFREDIHVARLTGAVVKPLGKKTTFE